MRWCPAAQGPAAGNLPLVSRVPRRSGPADLAGRADLAGAAGLIGPAGLAGPAGPAGPALLGRPIGPAMLCPAPVSVGLLEGWELRQGRAARGPQGSAVGCRTATRARQDPSQVRCRCAGRCRRVRSPRTPRRYGRRPGPLASAPSSVPPARPAHSVRRRHRRWRRDGGALDAVCGRRGKAAVMVGPQPARPPAGRVATLRAAVGGPVRRPCLPGSAVPAAATRRSRPRWCRRTDRIPVRSSGGPRVAPGRCRRHRGVRRRSHPPRRAPPTRAVRCGRPRARARRDGRCRAPSPLPHGRRLDRAGGPRDRPHWGRRRPGRRIPDSGLATRCAPALALGEVVGCGRGPADPYFRWCRAAMRGGVGAGLRWCEGAAAWPGPRTVRVPRSEPAPAIASSSVPYPLASAAHRSVLSPGVHRAAQRSPNRGCGPIRGPARDRCIPRRCGAAGAFGVAAGCGT